MDHYSSLQKLLISKKENSDIGITFINSNDEDVYISYQELYQLASNKLYQLQKKGLTKGDSLVFQVDSNYTFIVFFWACILGAVIPIPIVIGNNDDQRMKLVYVWRKLSNPFLLTHKAILSKLEEFANQYKEMDTYNKIKNKTVFVEQLEEPEKCEGIFYPVEPDNLCFVQFSSGSTGMSKGVMLTHKNIITNIESMIFAGYITKNDSFFNWMPLYHDMGLIGAHILSVYRDINQYIMSTKAFIRNPLLWLEKVSQYRSTLISSPNFGYKYCLDHLKRKKNKVIELSCVRQVVNGAEPISYELFDSFVQTMRTYGLKLNTMYPVYGLAEASLAVTFPEPAQYVKPILLNRNKFKNNKVKEEIESGEHTIQLVNVGKPVPNTSVKITDDDNNTLPENCIGNILIKGDNVTKGYYNDPELTNKTIDKDGWLRTGDLGFFRDQLLYVTGRAKDIIFINGQNYYPHDLEDILKDLDNIDLNKIAVCGIYDKRIGSEAITVFIYNRKSMEDFFDIAQNIKRYLFKKTGLEVQTVIPVKSLPKTTSGKIQRYKLIEMFENGLFKDVCRHLDKLLQEHINQKNREISNKVESELLSICRDELKMNDIGIDDNFMEYGVNSMLISKIQNMIEDRYPGKIKVTDFFSYPTIRQISSLLNADIDSVIDGVSMPEDYFQIPPLNLYIYNVTIPNESGIKIKEISRQFNVTSIHIITALFSYVILNKSNQKDVSIQVGSSNNDYFTRFVLDNDIVMKYHADSMKDYVEYVHSLICDNDKTRFNYSNVHSTEIRKSTSALLPLIIDNHDLVKKHRLKRFFDLILLVSDHGESLCIESIYNENRINNKKVDELLCDTLDIISYFSNNIELDEVVAC